MISRFEGESGRAAFITALLDLKIVSGNRELAEVIADSATLSQI